MKCTMFRVTVPRVASIASPAPWTWPKDKAEDVMGPDECLMIGDNRTMRVDEHEFGAAKRSKLVGRVLGGGAR